MPNDKWVVVVSREFASKLEVVVLLVGEEPQTGSANSRMVSSLKLVEKVLPKWLWEVARRAMLVAASGATAARTASWTACLL